ncbi:hypothetical protein E0500_041225 [Streptomyces sp. KM273126]|uniref:hypothetical protein n=1 Tax=Streptomyces sp. KM273126 TaxID=2545247 RepID=UPI00103CBCEE|nr:hypothetical protein [Streptomyces sp. KM273126]MBA2813575.1 hypothetical protein [Streptomyces sp. KM273126]
MRTHCLRGPGSPTSGALRGLRAGVLAVLCVLLPLAGHVLAQGHAPQWLVVAAMAAVALPGALLLTRHRLTDTQLLGVLVLAQLTYHVVYSLPGACAAVTGQDGSAGGPLRLIEHDATAGPPPGVLVAGHLVSLLLAARLLGVTERLLWQSTSLLVVVRGLLLFFWPLFGGRHGTGPQAVVPESSSPLMSALLVRLHAGRAPPRRGHGPFVLLRPTPLGALHPP